MEEKQKLSSFMVKLASLMDEHSVSLDYTGDDDGIHFCCGSEDVAIMSPTSDDLIQKAMVLSSNLEAEINDIKAKHYSLDALKSKLDL